MNFKQIQDEVLMYVDEKKAPQTLKIIKSGINYAYRKLAEDKFKTKVVELNNDDDEPITELDFDHKILAFFGAYFFFKIDGDDEGKGSTWLNLFNDGFDKTIGLPQEKVEVVYSCL